MERFTRGLASFCIIVDTGLLWIIAIEHILRFKEAHEPFEEILLKGFVFLLGLVILSRLGWKIAKLVY